MKKERSSDVRSCKALAYLLVCVCVLTSPGSLLAATDNVLSGNIKEAVVGSTDQNTNAGSGVKTGHLVDTAVTTAKIASSAVTAEKIAAGSVTSEKLGADVQSRIASLENRLAQAEAALAALQGSPALQIGAYVRVEEGSVEGLRGPHIIFEGANLHVRSGSGFSYEEPQLGAPLGLGNLIIGYNEFTGEYQTTGERTGSHNLIVGKNHDFTASVGLAVGGDHQLRAPFASVSGGRGGLVGGAYGSVAGGVGNAATGWYSAVSGGGANTASGPFSSVSGGAYNFATGQSACVSGGNNNRAVGATSSIAGGSTGTALGVSSTVVGGSNNSAHGEASSVGGGVQHHVYGTYDWAAGTLFQEE